MTRLIAIALALFMSSTVLALGGDIKLTDHHGEDFRLSDHRDKVVVLFFGYTYCPDICPDTLAKIATALSTLQDSDDVQVVFVSLDPHRDTPEHISSYLAYFDQRYIGLSGNWSQLKQVAADWNVRFNTPESIDSDTYLVDHSADVYVIERGGKLHSVVPYGLSGEHLAKVLEGALAQGYTLAPTPEPGLRSLENEAVEFATERSRAAVLHFWATWCIPCRLEFADLEAARIPLSDIAMDFYTVNLGDSAAGVRRFLEDYPLSYSMLLDQGGYSARRWAVTSLPQTLVLGVKGQELARLRGPQEWTNSRFIDALRELIEVP